MSGAKRTNAGVAAAGLFSRPSATGGLATREPVTVRRVASSVVQRLRQGVELLAEDVDFLRELGRPVRTGQPRTLGSKFVATGVLAGAIRVLRERGIDMDGIEAGDHETMAERAYQALISAGEQRSRS